MASKKPSGAQFRQRAKEKLEKKEKLLKITPTLDKFFSGPLSQHSPTPVTSSGSSYSSTSIVENRPFKAKACDDLKDSGKCAEEKHQSSELEPTKEIDPNTEKNVDKGELLEEDEPDPAKWKITEALRDKIALCGVKQNDDSDFLQSTRKYADGTTRHCTKSLFSRRHPNGETCKRVWLIYSKSTGAVFCAVCKLFGGSTKFATVGFSDWRNPKRIDDHETGPEHRQYVSAFIARARISSRIDSHLIEQLAEEVTYWRNVLLRVVEAIKMLTSRGLAIRGHSETIGNVSNGNFLGVIELIAKFDTFMADHIARFGNAGKGIPSYLSHNIIDELIVQMAQQVRDKIVDEIKNAKYYSIIIDSTPDISHIDQLTVILRYVNEIGSPVERFLTFLPNTGHTGQQLVDALCAFLNKMGIDLANCRGQSYDNAANMSGQYSGVQARIRELNPLATYVPCAAHSLNLVGKSAAGLCEPAITFFGLEQTLYNFFSSSTHRWDILMSKVSTKPTVKTLSSTRWSARAEASKALITSYKEIMNALLEISESDNEKPDTRLEAENMHEKLSHIETAIMVCFWSKVLDRFNQINKKLQTPKIGLDTVTTFYSTLYDYLNSIRDDFDLFEVEAVELCGSNLYQYDTKRKRKRKVPFDEMATTAADEYNMDGRAKFRIDVFIQLVDKLKNELIIRQRAYEIANRRFGFFAKLQSLSDDEIKTHCSELTKLYPNDLEEGILENECVQLKDTSRMFDSLIDFLEYLRAPNLRGVFPNCEIALRMHLSTAVTNCSGERSFSVLKRVKNYLRSTMTEKMLNSKALLAIENEIFRKLDFSEVVEKFAHAKARKKSFS